MLKSNRNPLVGKALAVYNLRFLAIHLRFQAIAVDGANPNFQNTTTPGTYSELNNAQVCDNVAIMCVPVSPSNYHWLIPASGLGNVGRNTIETSGFHLWNMSLQRTLKFAERYSFTLRGEFYNVFNHGNLGINGVGSSPSYMLSSPDFANLPGSLNGGRTVRIDGKFFF